MSSLLINLARLTPDWIKRIVHNSAVIDSLMRRTYGALLGSGTWEIPAGPMRGLLLEKSKHVSHAHLRGTYERALLDAIDRVVKPGMVCYDVGASIGYISLLMARRAKQVYAFEPAPHAISEIERHAAANKFSNISIVRQPVSDSIREVTFQLTDAAYGSAIGSGDSRWKSMTFNTTSLDIFAESHELPDVIKMDIEGEEGRALDGARRVLTEKRPLLICEIHNNAQAVHVGRVLEECEYDIFELDGKTKFLPEGAGQIIAGMVQVLATPRNARAAG